jgi:hypothetical protein
MQTEIPPMNEEIFQVLKPQLLRAPQPRLDPSAVTTMLEERATLRTPDPTQTTMPLTNVDQVSVL